jgi:hypothetical protein
MDPQSPESEGPMHLCRMCGTALVMKSQRTIGICGWCAGAIQSEGQPREPKVKSPGYATQRRH